GRRLLHAAGDVATATPSRFGARAAAVVALLVIPAVTLGVYMRVGSPDTPDQPLKPRLAAQPQEANVQTAISKIEMHLAANPDDGRGWEVLAPVYMRLGKFTEAARAFGEAARILGETPQRLGAQAQALVYAANDTVTPEARDLFQRVLALSAADPTARYFLALAREQAGDRQGALQGFTALSAETPADAPWQEDVRARIVALGGTPPAGLPPEPDAGAAIRGMPQAEQQAAIRGMVDSLAARLQQDGRDVEGWLRLTRAYTVLRERELAVAAIGDARKALADDKAAIGRIDDLAKELGLEG
ncbi:MAG: c-type cytochrome biogenesis protein CcmI, partial [Beijerinckiaceae bacterium]|nr:c-type cytochrome biogenesis protein CcmI [Beijerinckiaceae bacterium]